MDPSEILCGEAYRLACDVTYKPGMVLDRDGVSVFIKTDYAPDFLASGHGGKRCVMVTHESDYVVNDQMASLMPPNVLRWFGVNIIANHPRCESIPLGIGSPWYEHGNAQAVADAPGKINARRWGYARFAIDTNINERSLCHRVAANASWVTCQTYMSHTDKPLPFTEYLAELSEHMFVLCPCGNGPDTHRIWETLYCGRIPIVLTHPALLPFWHYRILFLECWQHLEICCVVANLMLMAKRALSMDGLKASYWKKRFNQAKEQLA